MPSLLVWLVLHWRRVWATTLVPKQTQRKISHLGSFLTLLATEQKCGEMAGGLKHGQHAFLVACSDVLSTT